MTRAPVLILAASFACAPAYADRRTDRPVHQQVVDEAPVVQSPYQIDLIDNRGRTLPTYQHRGKFYVQGSVDQRYIVRISNPTDQRIEAVVSVDGLDVIDGEVADVGKRGYIVPAHGELRIEGFRVSTREVAAFRFSSVPDSYAGRKGKARNVGVVGVAIFEEEAPPQVVLEQRQPPPLDYDDYDFEHYDRGYDAPAPEASGGEGRGATRNAPKRSRSHSKAPPAATDSASESAPVLGGTTGHRRPSECCAEPRPRQRPGLGTEFGERRHSAVSFTRFERRNPTRPDAYAELRYNDAGGLRALGISIDDPYDGHELELRETANPFPHSRSFAQPPPR